MVGLVLVLELGLALVCVWLFDRWGFWWVFEVFLFVFSVFVFVGRMSWVRSCGGGCGEEYDDFGVVKWDFSVNFLPEGGFRVNADLLLAGRRFAVLRVERPARVRDWLCLLCEKVAGVHSFIFTV